MWKEGMNPFPIDEITYRFVKQTFYIQREREGGRENRWKHGQMVKHKIKPKSQIFCFFLITETL